MAFDLKTALASIAPTIATMLGGPLAGTAVAALEGALGLSPGAGQDAITKVVQSGMTPEAIAAVRAADQAHAERLKQMDIDVLKLNADHDAAITVAVNATMQAEAASDHWPTYTWRPAIGFSVAFNTVVASILVIIVYIAVVAGSAQASVAMTNLPMVLGALAAISATVLPILGIASYFRGKAQADPAIPTDNRG